MSDADGGKKMLVAIDFDDTYTADPELWDQFIDNCMARGHKVVMVTCRRDTADNREECNIPALARFNHYFTGLSPKRWYMEHRGIKVDVWIDDMPETVKEGR